LQALLSDPAINLKIHTFIDAKIAEEADSVYEDLMLTGGAAVPAEDAAPAEDEHRKVADAYPEAGD
jgi:hypothetical protein